MTAAPRNRRACLKAAWAGAGWMCAPAVWAARPAGQPAFRVGLTAVILADQSAFLTRWAHYMEQRMGVPISFVARESYQVILDLLFAEQLDAAWICGYPYVLHRPRLRLLAVPLFNGKPAYQAYLISQGQRRPAIEGWGDLKGRVLAYSDPLSNSGWLVAQGQLRANGLTPADLLRSFFAHGHRNVAQAVASGLAHAGCIDGYVWETMQLQGIESALRTQVVWRSDWYAFPPLVALRSNRNPVLLDFAAVLQNMAAEAKGVSLLRALNLSGFAEPDAQAYEPIRAQAARVGALRT